jgi:hypothetical protein
MFQALLRAVLAAALLAACGPDAVVKPCGLANESLTNHTRDTPAALAFATATTACVARSGEDDWFEVTTPDDAAGGSMKISLTNVGLGDVDVKIFAAADNGLITEQYADNQGASLTVWFAAAKSQKYRVVVSDFSGFPAEYKYTLQADYTKVNDTFEPNDTQATAKPLTVGTLVNAFMFTGYKGATIDETEFPDWYSVALTGTSITVSAESIPTDLTIWVELFDSGGTSMQYEIGANEGASKTLVKTGLTPGNYFVMLKAFSPNATMGVA